LKRGKGGGLQKEKVYFLRGKGKGGESWKRGGPGRGGKASNTRGSVSLSLIHKKEDIGGGKGVPRPGSGAASNFPRGERTIFYPEKKGMGPEY